MEIIGIKSGAVLQRDVKSNCCKIYLEGSFSDDIKVSCGSIAKISENEWCLQGIPVGGPYEIKFFDRDESVVFSEIYVGDLWLLAGQSNMEGAGRIRTEDREYEKAPLSEVRAMYMNDEWDVAKGRLHQLWLSPDKPHIKVYQDGLESYKERNIHIYDLPPNEQIRGIGPGLFFAKELYTQTKIPQGVIPCAVGGAPIEMWTPNEDEENYYSAAIRRLSVTGKNVRGMFWYQGEGYNQDLSEYSNRFEKIRNGIAEICRMENLPTVQAQVFKSNHPVHAGLTNAFSWSNFRMFQYEMQKKLPCLSTVATNDLELDDLIHLSADSHEKLGKRAADAMRFLVDGAGMAEPEIDKITVKRDSCVGEFSSIVIRFKNVVGSLGAMGVPSGFSISEKGEKPSNMYIQRTLLDRNSVEIRVELTIDQIREKELWYCFGNDFYCNIQDDRNHAIYALGPISLENVEEEF